jgi:hypothetical protein
MIAQQHKIMRQVLEVRGCSRDAAQHLQSELRDAYRERLLPLIEAICSELSAPGRIDRVDRLEIDLGELPLETFEAALADSFAPAFRSRWPTPSTMRRRAMPIWSCSTISSGREPFPGGPTWPTGICCQRRWSVCSGAPRERFGERSSQQPTASERWGGSFGRAPMVCSINWPPCSRRAGPQPARASAAPDRHFRLAARGAG